MTENSTRPVWRKTIWLSVAAVIGVQSAALLWMIAGRVSLLKNGREMVVEVVPVDPRDIFRGEYVALGYTFTGTGDTTLPAGTKRGDRVYATLEQVTTLEAGGGSKWRVVAVSAVYPDKLEPGQAVLSGIASDVWGSDDKKLTHGRIRYGIETYYVPEGKGRELEQMVREKKIEAVLAVNSRGEAAIKALMIDGKRVHEEPVL